MHSAILRTNILELDAISPHRILGADFIDLIGIQLRRAGQMNGVDGRKTPEKSTRIGDETGKGG